MTISIIGYGWVGKAMKSLFPDAIIYDPQAGFKDKTRAFNTDLAFVCVPTPNKKNGSLDCSIIESTIKELNSKVICIRSTVMPGTTDYLSKKYKKNIVFQPEYLGETPDHPMLNQFERKFMILGGNKKDNRTVIDAYSKVFNANINIKQVTAIEAEIIKISSNRSIAHKVAECQELYDACEAAGVDYYTIRDGVYGDDPRMNLWWTFIYPEKRGMNSKCLPKDLLGWCAWAESVGYIPKISKEIIEKNSEWINSKPRKV